MKYSRFSVILFFVLLLAISLSGFLTFSKHSFLKIAPIQNPTILFVPGLGLEANDYRSFITHLQSDHYTVIVYKPTDENPSNYQNLVKTWTKGIGKLVGKRKVIVIGHSVGGSVAAYFCSIDSRCIAGVNMDGSAAFLNNIPVPFLYLQADAGSYCDMQCFLGRTEMEAVASESGSTVIHISGIKHYNFTDLRTATLEKEDYLGPKDGRDIIYTDVKSFLNDLPR